MQKKNQSNKSLLIFLSIFFLFFIYEYGSPIWQFYQAAQQHGVDFALMLEQRQVLKHLLRFPFYLAVYVALFLNFFQKKSKKAYWLLNFLFITRMILKPLLIIYSWYMLSKMENFSLELNISQLIFGIGMLWIVYGYFLAFIRNWWQDKKIKE